MSGLATICVEQGFPVSGCDTSGNGCAQQLRTRGVPIEVGHHPRHLTDEVGLLVYSSAVRPDEPELLDAKSRGIWTMGRGEFLAALAAEKRLIGIAGAHGKTTTSGMLAQLLLHAGWDPTIAIGGMMLSTGTNARAGRGAYMVAETDESDGSFLHLSPHIAVVTNIDREHLTHYREFQRLIAAFGQFVEQLTPGGTLVRCYDDPVVRRALSAPSQLSYGCDPEADVTARHLAFSGRESAFRAYYRDRDLGLFHLQVPGRHNVLNALAVIGVGLTLEVPLITLREALAAFQGTQRRFQVFQLPGDIWFVEDYAHHPSEIRATLAADASANRHRLVVFQPHRFTRTQSLEREFTTCFDLADGVIVTDIYSAFEPSIPGVSGHRLADLIRAHGHPCVRYVPKRELASHVSHIARSGDTIFFLGAGDIGTLCRDMVSRTPGATGKGHH